MRDFFTLVGFEYKKIFKSKIAVLALLSVIILMVFNTFTFVTTSRYDTLVAISEEARQFSGRVVDETLLAEIIGTLTEIDAGTYTGQAESFYTTFSSKLLLSFVYYYVYDTDMGGLSALTEDELRNYYQIRNDEMTLGINSLTLFTDAAKEKILEMNSKIEAPFIFYDMTGFEYLGNSTLWPYGLFCALALAVCFAPLFAGEYTSRADQLILSSKWGKSKLIWAKIFTAFSISVMYFIVFAFIAVMISSYLFGLDGANAQFLLFFEGIVAYPLTVLQVFLFYAFCIFLAIFLIVAITLLLSATFKSPFAVIILVAVFIFAPVFFDFGMDIPWRHHLMLLLPTNMMNMYGVYNPLPMNIFGIPVFPHVFIPTFAVSASIAALAAARRFFRNHQIA